MRCRGETTAAVIGLVLFAAGGARGQDADAAPAPTLAAAGESSEEARAVELFQAGERAYFAGDYEQAIFHPEQAVALRSNPVLLYNLARSYERADRLDEAIATYRAYLDASPAAADRETIEARIASLERERVERAASEARLAPTAAPGPEPSEPVVASSASAAPPATVDEGAGAVPWILAGVGALAIGGGAGLWLVANDAHDKAEAEPRQQRAYDLQSRAEDLAMAGNITVAAGGVVLVAGLLWGILDVTEGPAGTDARQPRLRARAGVLQLEGRW